MNQNLSRIIADLVAKAKGGGDVSSEIRLVRDQIKKVIESEDSIYGKLRGLVESFGEIIPEEKQRYHLAVKALSMTSNLGRQEIVAAVENQLQELKILEKVLVPGLPGWSDELKIMETKAQETRSEIARLRERLAFLEKEEKEIADRMAGRGKQMTVVEKAMQEVFRDIGAEIAAIKRKVEDSDADTPAAYPRPVADGVKKDIFVEQKHLSSGGNAKLEKICPMCGAPLTFAMNRNIWQCYSCAYEERERDDITEKNEKKREPSIFPEPGEYSNVPEPREPIFPGPGDHSSAAEPREQKTVPEPAPGSTLRRKCPMCGGQMDYYLTEGKWLCFSCGFEYAEKNAGQGKSEETSGQGSAIESISISEPLFDIPSAKKGPRVSSGQPAIKKKPCPACEKKMHWHESEKAWRCPHCQYERRI